MTLPTLGACLELAKHYEIVKYNTKILKLWRFNLKLPINYEDYNLIFFFLFFKKSKDTYHSLPG